MKVLLFGTGEYYSRYKIWFEHEKIVALIDNSEEKQGTMIDGFLVVSPKEAVEMDYDTIFIMSFYFVAMKNQLIGLGVPEDKIFHFYDIHDIVYNQSLKKEIQFYGIQENESTDRGILLLNQDLTLGGPALALFHAAKVLVKNGYKVTYGSQLDGPLRQVLVKEGIPVVVDLNLLVQTMDECDWIRGYSLILCNTINFHVFLSKRDTSIPMIWWLHDSSFFYDAVNRNAIFSIPNDNLKVWGVGPVSQKAINNFRPDFKVEDMIYGVQDTIVNKRICNSRADDIVKFVTIGYIEERKGQDVLVEAIKLLPEEIKRKTKFTFVGRNTSILAHKVMEDARKIREIEFIGLVGREQIDKILVDSDILICPSREDPMPTVCAEAMMHSVPCLISDAVGTAKYISILRNGIVFHSEDTNDLMEKILWVVTHKHEITDMRNKARRTFENVFEMSVFEKRFLELLDR